MDEELRRLERAALRLGDRYAALLTPRLVKVEPDPAWERVTWVGLSGHPGCLVSQRRNHYFLARVYTIAALAALPGAHLIVDLETRSLVRPTWDTDYLWDFEDGWTKLSNKTGGDSYSGPFRPLERLWRRDQAWRGPMHVEIDERHADYRAKRIGYGLTCDDEIGCVHPR